MLSEVLIVASVGRAPRIECVGGLAGRRTDADTVHLISAAATPLGGDTISIRVVVEAGAVLRVRSAAATMAMPGTVTMESRATWDLEVHGHLDVDPQPTIVAGAARHVTSTRLALGEGGTVRVRERVQIGRSHERHGTWSGSMRADADATPVLRHRVELGAGSVTDDELASPRAYVSELRYPQAEFDGAGTMLQLAAGGCLATWQGDRL
ncbi:urease accessory protein UreD [Mycobacterium yunnanensis]|uniref:Urease accessory protein UreD n=1 Tax=Mycobacterium yunnanensis TaxID=368477 RepID=A0A9X3C2D2_9MYCO|nr:urease accessory protein UreD [Mycobacterium yunnanensis]MCV7420097.1 urease accessory protein UreD [Mycobacterium yunnanensis]